MKTVDEAVTETVNNIYDSAKTVILCRRDFKNEGAMTFDALVEDLGLPAGIDGVCMVVTTADKY